MQVKKQQLEPCMELLTHSGLRKEYDKAVYCHPVYLTYTQSTSCEMLGWMGYKLESRLLESINHRYVDDTTRMAESKKELKSLLMRVTKEGEKANLKLNIKETKIMASSPITSWQIDGETANSGRLYLGRALKSLQMVTAAMKLKDACSLEEKL